MMFEGIKTVLIAMLYVIPTITIIAFLVILIAIVILVLRYVAKTLVISRNQFIKKIMAMAIIELIIFASGSLLTIGAFALLTRVHGG